MSVETTYCINAPHVISEIIDGEAIILNFESGSYYSLNLSGMAVWTCLQEGHGEAEVLVKLRQRFPDAGDDLASDLSEIVKQLAAEQLIVPSETIASPTPDREEEPATPYAKPALEKFTDLQELLLLDPIHDVDGSGWPHQAV